MQTFLPYMDFTVVSQILDKKRLGKQRVEARQIIDILEGRSPRSKWKEHITVRMWKGYENALKLYFNTMVISWIRRGCENHMLTFLIEGPIIMPPWISDTRLHYSHRANLFRKSPAYYNFWSDYELTTPYWWPYPLKDKYKQANMEKFWGEHECCIEILDDMQEKLILMETANGQRYQRRYDSRDRV
jgi:hypothetical protein